VQFFDIDAKFVCVWHSCRAPVLGFLALNTTIYTTEIKIRSPSLDIWAFCPMTVIQTIKIYGKNYIYCDVRCSIFTS